MNKRVTECRIPAETASANCTDSKLNEPSVDPCTVSTADPCTVGSKDCDLMSGDPDPRKKQPQKTDPAEEDDEDYCCFDH